MKYYGFIHLSLALSTDVMKYRDIGDVDKQKALDDLRILSIQLSAVHVKTSVELLQESEDDKTECKIKLDENKVPYILQEKYIMVPTCNNENTEYTSVFQEHIMGSNDYVLSLDSPTRVYKLATVHT